MKREIREKKEFMTVETLEAHLNQEMELIKLELELAVKMENIIKEFNQAKEMHDKVQAAIENMHKELAELNK